MNHVRGLVRRLPVFWRIRFFVQNTRCILSGTREFPSEFYQAPGRKVAYLPNAKAACTSIHISLLGLKDVKDNYSVFSLRREFYTEAPADEDGWFTFTFVRNPFDRLVSCCESKFHKDREKNRQAISRGYFDFDRYLHGYLKKDDGFACFVSQIARIPWRLDNAHFCSQYRRIVGRDGKPLVDYIGRFEGLEEDYEPIRQKYGFDPLQKYNSSDHGDWRDYYTTKPVKKVYRKYRKDVKYFEYEQDYHDLLLYCAEKEGKS